MGTGTSLPEPRNEEESILSYRMGQLEHTVRELKDSFEKSNFAVLSYKVGQLEVWRNRIIAAITAIALLVIGGLLSGDIHIGGS